MNKIKFNGVTTIREGFVKLSDDQARRRKAYITQVEKGKPVYMVDSPISFKAGEEIGLDGGIDKAWDIEILEGEKPKVHRTVEKQEKAKEEKAKKAPAKKAPAKKAPVKKVTDGAE